MAGEKFIDTIYTDTINEKTAANGVNVDGVLLKDGSTQVDSHVEFTELASAPTTPSAGFGKLYRKNDGKMYVVGSDGIESPVGAGGTIDQVTQATHGFLAADVGRPLYKSATVFAFADASAGGNAEVAGLINRVIDVNTFEVILGGKVSGLTANAFSEAALPAVGDILWLSSTPGKLTITEPSVVGQIEKPLGICVDSGAMADVYLFNMRGSVVGGANLYTTISLANNTTTSFHTIQGVAGTGGWISGTIKIDATTDYVIPFFCHFSRQLDGTTYNVSPSFGDTIPAGLLMVNSGSSIQVTLPNLAGFVSAAVTYCVQAAANGTALPVNISPASISGAADIACQTGYGISFGNETLKAYDEGSFTATYSTSYFTVQQTATYYYVVSGKMVTLSMATVTGTSNATTAVGTGLPAALIPARDQNCTIDYVGDNGSTVTGGIVRIKATSGDIEWYKNAFGAFTASGTKTLSPFTISYLLN